MHAKRLMYASEILKFLRSNIQDSHPSIIVTSIDKLPEKVTLPLYMVVNEDYSTQPGSHWICLHINNDRHAIYLDSFGRKPLQEIEKFIDKHAYNVEVSRIQLQMSTSTLCGAFSAIALIEFSRKKSLKHFLSTFAQYNRYLNDLIIMNMSVNNCINKFST